MRSAVSFHLKAVLKRVFSSFRKLQKLSVLFLSCNSAVRLKSFPLRHFSKPFHMRWQDQFLGDPCHLTLCFIVDNWTYQTKLWPCRPANKHQQKEKKKNEREFEGMQLDQKKHLRISPTLSEYAAYNASGCLDTCKRRKRFNPTRVNAPKISGSLTSGYPDIRIQYVSVIEWPDITIYRVLW